MPGRRRPPAVAGQFYPADPGHLGQMVDEFVANAPDHPLDAPPIAIVAPHAGYAYSGAVAGAAFRAVRSRSFETVIVVGPSHHDHFQGASVFDGDAWETPLGEIEIDGAARRRVLEAAPDIVRAGRSGHRDEHSIEVEVPFVQRLFPSARLLPIAMLERSPRLCRRLGEALAPVVAEGKALVVLSSDLYHGPSSEACDASDSRTLDGIRDGDAERFLAGISLGRYQACGAGPIAVGLETARARGGPAVEVLLHRTSADVTGPGADYVVGYGAVALRGARPASDSRPSPDAANEHDGDDASDADLLADARDAITQTVAGRDLPELFASWGHGTAEAGGVFVTLWKHGQLRGCIGVTARWQDLRSTTRQVACASAFRDPRFDPVTSDELADLTIEISLLTPLRVMRPVRPAAIRIGVDGLQIEHHGVHGLLLPHVASQAGWNADRFLEETCRKAGLPRDTWRDPDAVVSVFQTRLIRESG